MDELKKSFIRFDDIVLEKRCIITTVSFTQTEITGQEGQAVQLCVALEDPSWHRPTTVAVALVGSGQPHFGGFTEQIVTFPTGSAAAQCITIPSAANGVYDGGSTEYTFELRNPDGGNFAATAPPTQLTVRLYDDVDPALCDWAGPNRAVPCQGDTTVLGLPLTAHPAFCDDARFCFRWESTHPMSDAERYVARPTVAVTQDARFFVFVTDGDGNLFTDTVDVAVAHPTSVDIGPAVQKICPGGSLTLSVDRTSGSGNYAYQWSTGTTTPTASVTQPGTYALTLTDLTTGCTATDSVVVVSMFSDDFVASGNYICADAPQVSIGFPSLTSSRYSFIWSNGATGNAINPTMAGTYSVTVTEQVSGCTAAFSHTVVDLELPDALVIEAVPPFKCPDGQPITLRARVNGLDLAAEGATYNWSTGETTPEVVVADTDIYGLLLKLGACEVTTFIAITESPNFPVTIAGADSTQYACPESPLALSAAHADGLGEVAWAWSSGEATREIAATAAGTYTVTVTDPYGCTHIRDVVLDACPTIVYFEHTQAEVQAGEEAELCVLLANPGTEPTTVQVNITGDAGPYFDAAAAQRTLTFAPGTTRQCLTYAPDRMDGADSLTVYTLLLANPTGGNAAAIGMPREAALAVKAGIRCQVVQDSSAVNCAIDSTSVPSDAPLITVLKADDSFWAGDFEVRVAQATGSGTFNGTGYIQVPYFEQVRVNVKLIGVQVNEHCQMVDGEVKVEGVGAALLSEELANALDDLLSTLEDIDNVLGVAQQVLSAISTVVNASTEMGSVLSTPWNVLQGADPIYEEYPYLPDSLRNEINAAILCYVQNPPDVCNENLSATVAAVIAAINAQFEAGYAIRFRAFEEQRHGFDSLRYTPMADDYNYLTVANQPYNVAWKSVEAGGTDSVSLATPFADLPTDLTFETNARTPVPHHPHAPDGSCVLPIHGTTHEDTYQIYPVQTRTDAQGNPEKKYAGKLNVVSYERKQVEVVLVPVNGAGAHLTEADRAAMEVRLNEIYAPAVVGIGLELLAPALQLDWFANEAQSTLDSTNSRFYADYNAQMQRINQSVSALPNYDRHKYYMVLVPAAQGGIRGFMPRGRNKGFVVVDADDELPDLVRTLAHELGHGAFLLQHPWEEYRTLTPGQTDNLMDYSAGTALYKYQWDLVHNPPVLGGAGDGDEEGAYISISVAELSTLLNPVDSTYSFLSPSGKIITLPKNITSVELSTGDELSGEYGVPCVNQFTIMPFGVLAGFTILQSGVPVQYGGCFDCVGNNEFSNYYIHSTTAVRCVTPYLDSLTHKHNRTSAIIGFPCFENGEVKFQAGKIPYTSSGPSANPNIPSGAILPYDHLMGYIHTLENVTTLASPNIYPDFSSDAIDFLHFVSDVAACGHPSLVYAFAHANQISLYPAYYKPCGTSILETAQARMQDNALVDIVRNNYLRETTLLQASFTSSGWDFSGTDDEYPSNLKAEIDAWIAEDVSIHKDYQQAYDKWNSDTTFWQTIQELTAANADKLAREFIAWKDYPCIFTNLTASQRLHAIQLFSLLELTEDNFIDYLLIVPVTVLYDEPDEEFILNLVLKSAPQEEWPGIIALLEQDEYAIFKRFAGGIEDFGYFFVDSYYEEFLTLITRMVMASGQRTADCSLQADSQTTCWRCDIQGQQYDFEAECVIALGVNFDGMSDCNAYSSSIRLNGNIILDREFSCPITQDGQTTIVTYNSRTEGKPFDYVAVQITESLNLALIDPQDNTVSMGQLGSGNVLVMPFCYAHLVFNRIRAVQIAYRLRASLDVLALVTFPLSGGASASWRALATADALYSGADIYFAQDQYDYQVSGTNAYSQQMHDLWNGAGIVLLSANGTQLVRQVGSTMYTQFNLSRTLRTVEEIKRIPLASSESIWVLKHKLQGQKALLETHLPDNLESARFKVNLQAAIDEMDFNAKFVPQANTTPVIHYTPAANITGEAIDGQYRAYAIVAPGSASAIGTIDEVGGVANTLKTQNGTWDAVTPAHAPVGRLTDISFTDAGGRQWVGDVELLHNSTTGRIAYRVTRTVGDGLPGSHPLFTELFNHYQRKGWIWAEDAFGPNVVAFMDDLAVQPPLRQAFLDAISSFEQYDDFLQLLDDINQFPIFAAALKARPELVRAWEVVPANLRTEIPNLEKVSSFQAISPNSSPLIQAEFASLPPNHHQSFINGLGNVANNNVLSSSLTLNRIPDVSEISASTARTAEFRASEGIQPNRNLGYVEGNVSSGNVQTIDNRVWSSGAADVNTEPQIFQAQDIGWLRNTDSEYKMLNQLAADLGGSSGNTYPAISGNLKIAPCNGL